jgi:hypothetical protein
MKLPEEVFIFGRTYGIRNVSPCHLSEGVLGLASYRDGLVYLDQGTDLWLGLSTLWHEAVHVAQQEILGTTDEAQARWMALFIHNFLMENPQLVRCYLPESRPMLFEDDLGEEADD